MWGVYLVLFEPGRVLLLHLFIIQNSSPIALSFLRVLTVKLDLKNMSH